MDRALLLVFLVAAFACGCSTQAEIQTQLSLVQDVAITLNHSEDTAFSHGAVLHMAISETYDSYAWALDGASLGGETSSSVDVDSAPLTPGVHHLAVFVVTNGVLYSKGLRFIITN
jgi:hypothetical protein